MTCRTGKRCFTSKHQARKARSGVGNRFRVYMCPACRHFHVTRLVGR